ncbi:MAG: T9SS type A sorting domain-containing protein [candidate division WOR-3 bacterium]|nr:MAG: T9SS type A sorting domain-containing protein [candidate division WOR-3 bacterium]
MGRIFHCVKPITVMCVCALLIGIFIPLHAQWQNSEVDTLTNTQIRKETEIQSLDIDNLDFVHLVFKHDAAVGWGIYYITNSPAGTWQAPELVNDTDQVCYSPALAVSPLNDEPYITYEDDSEICFAYPSSSGWQQHMVTSDDRMDCYTTIAIDGAGRVHLAWITEDSLTLDYKIAYAIGDSIDWEVQILFGSELGPYGTGAVPYIAVTEDGIAHIVYRGGDYGDYHIHHAWNDTVGGSSWNYEIIMSGNVNDFSATLVVDDNDDLHLAMGGNDGWGFPGRVYYRYQPHGQNWQAYELASLTRSAVEPSIALDADKAPQIIWMETSGNFFTGYVYYSHQNTVGQWQVAYVIGDDHFTPSFKIDSGDYGHIACHSGGNTGNYDIFHVTSSDPLTSIKEYSNGTIPRRSLYHYPEPVTGSATFSYSIPTDAFVTLRIFNSLGQEVATFVNRVQPAGDHQEQWNITDLTSGIYFYSLDAGEYSATAKMIIVR